LSDKQTQALIHSVIQRIAVGPNRGRDISYAEAQSVMHAILSRDVDEVQTAVILIALRMKRESVDEMRGILSALMQEISLVSVPVSELICLADPFDGYQRCLPMTPFLPAVFAALGVPSCLSGVSLFGPKFGVTAEQVYRLAGISVDGPIERSVTQLKKHGWCYLNQQHYAPRLHALQSLRNRIIKRSALTTVERVLNPLRGRKKTHMVLGYVHRAYPEIYGAVAAEAGYSSALVVKGVEGGLAPAMNKPLRQFRFDFSGQAPEMLSQTHELPESIQGSVAAHVVDKGDKAMAEATLERGLQVLAGEHGPARSSLILAAAQVLWIYADANTLDSAVEKVERCLDNESALNKFNALRRSV